MPLVDSSYISPLVLRNAHLATIIPSLFRKVEGVNYERERIHTPDGDFLDIDWVKTNSKKLVIISHGLEGSAQRSYVKGMAKHFSTAGWDALAWNCRSCSGEMNWKPRFYHHGATEDLDEVIRYAIEKYGYETITLIGFSMGGSITLKYLGEKGRDTPHQIRAGAVFSVPVDLLSSVKALSTWGTAFYRKRFLKKLEQKIKEKAVQYPKEIPYTNFKNIRYFPDFDNLYTAPLHGFEDANDFYDQASAKHYMFDTRVPVLLVNAQNDPFLGDECYPMKEAGDHDKIYLETPRHGGHVGFSMVNSETNYMEIRALNFVNSYIVG